MADPPTNLRVIRRSRHKPQQGDIFAMQLPDGDYLFGRVILAEPEQAPMPASYLIYVFDYRRADKAVNPNELRPDQLLLPPVWINRMPWTKGYFEHVTNAQISPENLLAQHCFYDWTGDHLDETGRKLPGPVEPCGDWALSSYRWLDDHISDALGIPRVPSP